MFMRRLALLLSLCVCTAAYAQFEGLDLTQPDDSKKSDDKKADEGSEGTEGMDLTGGGMQGLDLTGAEVPAAPPELRPTLAILGVVAGDTDKVTQGRAELVAGELVRLAGEHDRFSTVMAPAVAAEKLGADAAKALACNGWACFDEVAKKLKVDRLMLATVSKSGAGSTIALKGFDPAINEVLGTQEDSKERAERSFAGFAGKSQARKDKAFLHKMEPFLASAISKLATPNGRVVLDNNEQSSVVSIDGVQVGTGAVDAVVQRGHHTVKVTAQGFLPFEAEVTVVPVKTVDVRVSLVARALEHPIAVEKPATGSGPPIYKRPGLYVAAAGVVIAGVGALLGSMAKGTEARARDANGDGVVDITRTEAKAAQGQAMTANVLMAAGGAAAAGGVVWIFVTPPESAAAVEPTEGGGFGVHVGVRGTF